MSDEITKKSIYENWILKGIHFARSWQNIKPFIKMTLGVESTTDMSRNDLSAFSTNECGAFSQHLSTGALSSPFAQIK